MKSSIDQLDLRRRRILAIMVAGFICAQAGMTVDRFTHPRGWIHIVLILLALAGWAVFGVQLLRMFRLDRAVRGDPGIVRALNDEYVAAKRLRAFAAAFWATMVFQAGLVAAALFLPLEAGAVLQATITVGVAAAVGFFLYYDREGADA